ncbi:MAG: hypothetical protein A2Y60_00805 [Chloroflexi bacterium RBG_13_54_9]|nr:MAG: hypothetical protein A2Y60_00805 [Chloroflexi bacterium RBG_13_54_9]
MRKYILTSVVSVTVLALVSLLLTSKVFADFIWTDYFQFTQPQPAHFDMAVGVEYSDNTVDSVYLTHTEQIVWNGYEDSTLLTCERTQIEAYDRYWGNNHGTYIYPGGYNHEYFPEVPDNYYNKNPYWPDAVVVSVGAAIYGSCWPMATWNVYFTDEPGIFAAPSW